MISKKRYARLAGWLYLTVIASGVFAQFFVRNTLIVAGDAAATASNIIQSETLFRLGFASDLLMPIAYFFLPLALYQVLKDINKGAAKIMVLSVAVAVAILCINMLNQLAALLLVSGEGYGEAANTAQSGSLTMFFLEMHKNGYMIAQIFFGLWLLPLGYLVYKSGYFPKFIGLLLMIGSFGFLCDLFVYFIFPQASGTLSPLFTAPATIGEFSLCLWLLIFGIKTGGKHNRSNYDGAIAT